MVHRFWWKAICLVDMNRSGRHCCCHLEWLMMEACGSIFIGRNENFDWTIAAEALNDRQRSWLGWGLIPKMILALSLRFASVRMLARQGSTLNIRLASSLTSHLSTDCWKYNQCRERPSPCSLDTCACFACRWYIQANPGT